MGTVASGFFITYLIMPLLAIIMGFVAYFFAKKNKLLRSKKLIIYILLGGIILSLSGFIGFIDYWFMPYGYVSLQILYLILGWNNMQIIRYLDTSFKDDNHGTRKSYFVEFFIHFTMMFIGAALFSMIFNLCNELQYGLWACTCLFTFIFPTLFNQMYESYMNIPLEIYKVWKYTDKNDLSSFDSMDYNKLQVMELEVFKSAVDTSPSKIKAKAPDNMPFGIWFQKFLADYNTKFSSTPIEVVDGKSYDPYSWIFYIKPSFFSPRKYIDYDLSINDNQIEEKHTIIAKRVSEHTNQEIRGVKPSYEDLSE
ncbi:MAG: hypothetical protein RL662_11 [Bacteroidota bacterium]|jgi:hypothetical protein